MFTSLSTISQLCWDRSSWVEPVLSKDNVSAQGHCAVTPVRLKPIPFGLESGNLPLSHCPPPPPPPHTHNSNNNWEYVVFQIVYILFAYQCRVNVFCILINASAMLRYCISGFGCLIIQNVCYKKREVNLLFWQQYNASVVIFSFFLCLLARSFLNIMPGGVNFEIKKKHL